MAESSARVLQAQIRRTSRIAAAALAVSVLATPPLLALYAASGMIVQHPWLTVVHVDPGALGPLARVAVFTATLGGMAPLLWGLDQVRRMFVGYAAGDVFTEGAARRFRRFATALMLTGVTSPLAVTVLSLALSRLGAINPPAGVLTISSTDVGLLLVGLVLRVIAAVLYDAARLAEENAAFF